MKLHRILVGRVSCAVLGIWVVAASTHVAGQVPLNIDRPTEVSANAGPWKSLSPVRITYEGRIFFSFPNYDIAVSGTPGLPNQLPRSRSEGVSRIVFKNDRGMYWDGGNVFLHPANRHDLVTRYYYPLGYVSSPYGQWPPVPEEIAAEPTRVAEVPWIEPELEPRWSVPDRSPVPLPNLPPVPLPPRPAEKIVTMDTFPAVPEPGFKFGPVQKFPAQSFQVPATRYRPWQPRQPHLAPLYYSPIKNHVHVSPIYSTPPRPQNR